MHVLLLKRQFMRFCCVGLGLAFFVACGLREESGEFPSAFDRGDLASALPEGISLDSPVIPDLLYGESSQTVGEALANLQAYVREGTLYDGGMGREIRFERAGKQVAKKGQTRTAKGDAPLLIIKLP